MSWRTEVLDPVTMTDDDLRAELRHDLDVYDQAQHPLSKAAMGARINELCDECDRRPSFRAALSQEGSEGSP